MVQRRFKALQNEAQSFLSAFWLTFHCFSSGSHCHLPLHSKPTISKMSISGFFLVDLVALSVLIPASNCAVSSFTKDSSSKGYVSLPNSAFSLSAKFCQLVLL